MLSGFFMLRQLPTLSMMCNLDLYLMLDCAYCLVFQAFCLVILDIDIFDLVFYSTMKA